MEKELRVIVEYKIEDSVRYGIDTRKVEEIFKSGYAKIYPAIKTQSSDHICSLSKIPIAFTSGIEIEDRIIEYIPMHNILRIGHKFIANIYMPKFM